MSGVLIAYADGAIYADDLDLDREEIVLHTITGSDLGILDLDRLRLRILYDAGPWDRPFNLTATLLLYGSGRRPAHPVRGDVLIVGLDADGAPTDAPDDLADMFRLFWSPT